MVKQIRFATEEERREVAELVELDENAVVLADEAGNVAVVRHIIEVEPVLFRGSLRSRVEFISLIEFLLRNHGVPRYYFNVDSQDERFMRIVEKWGARRISIVPEHRYMRPLMSRKGNGHVESQA